MMNGGSGTSPRHARGIGCSPLYAGGSCTSPAFIQITQRCRWFRWHQISMPLLFFLIKATLIQQISFLSQIEFQQIELAWLSFWIGVFTQALMLQKVAQPHFLPLAVLGRALLVLMESLKGGKYGGGAIPPSSGCISLGISSGWDVCRADMIWDIVPTRAQALLPHSMCSSHFR